MKIEVNCQSSIKIVSDKIIYFDPFKIEKESHDADLIFITHDHYDHFSIEDISKIEKEDTVFVIPDCMYNMLGGENVIVINPDEEFEAEGYHVRSIPSYNNDKQFHPKDKGYVGYIIEVEGKKIYVAGDCDVNEDNLQVKCDIAIIPIGGKYTMNYSEAARLINHIKPELVIPTHYGSIVGNKDDGREFVKLLDEDIKAELILDEQ